MSRFLESTRLRELGYTPHLDDHLERAVAPAAHVELEPARVVFESHQQFRIAGADGDRAARPASRQADGEALPVVGDWVAFARDSDGTGLIHALLPRATCLSRKVAGKRTTEQVVAANVDTIFLVMGLDGDYNLRRLERFAVMAWESGAQPVVVLTKADLAEDPDGARLDASAAVPGVPVHAVSALTGDGMEPLGVFLEPGRTVALIGSSGAGKSTLLNRLSGSEVMRTGSVRESDSRGRHTTTHRQLVTLPNGGLLVDNPGVREIQLWADAEALGGVFSDIEELARACRFRDCRHGGEPGCAVHLAVSEGRLSAERLESWLKLDKELASLERRRSVAESRKGERALGRMYKRAQAEKEARKRRS